MYIIKLFYIPYRAVGAYEAYEKFIWRRVCDRLFVREEQQEVEQQEVTSTTSMFTKYAL